VHLEGARALVAVVASVDVVPGAGQAQLAESVDDVEVVASAARPVERRRAS
jgi:hypothetical protein